MTVALASFEITGLDFTQKRVLYPTKNSPCLFSVGNTSSQHLLSSSCFHYILHQLSHSLVFVVSLPGIGKFLFGPDEWCQKLHQNKEPPGTCHSRCALRSLFPLAQHDFLVGKHCSAAPHQPAAGWEGVCTQLGPAPAHTAVPYPPPQSSTARIVSAFPCRSHLRFDPE